MKKFTSLLAYELNRIKYAYLILIGIIISLQIAAVVQTRNTYRNTFDEYQKLSQGNVVDFLQENGPLQFMNVVTNSYYIFSIALGVLILLMYAVVIWYRDWTGRTSFSYRLLTLPGSRMSIFFAKFLTILFMILGLLAIQLILIVLEEKLLEMLSPTSLYEMTFLRETILYFPPFSLILPVTLTDFILHYVIGISILAVFFMMILMELSFKWKGLVADACMIVAFVLSIRVVYAGGWLDYLYPGEFLILWIIFWIGMFVGSVLISRTLLNRKINV